jgi:glutamate carboxypeptidase
MRLHRFPARLIGLFQSVGRGATTLSSGNKGSKLPPNLSWARTITVMRSAFLGCALLSSTLLSSAAWAAPDQKLLEAAKQAEASVIDSLKTMVLIESGSGDSAGLAKMADLLDDRLKSLGFTTRREKAVAPADKLPSNGADIVVGTLQGTGKGKIMLQAHMDTVYEKGILQTQAFRIDGNRVYGPGIADDKGGISVILHSLKILKDAGWKDFHTLTVLFNPDEEIGSRGSGELISNLADQHQTVLSFEPTTAKSVAKNEALLLGAAGGARVRLEVKGRASHAGAAAHLGRNAVLELAHQMLQTKDLAKDIPGVTLNWTNVKADQATNQIPELAVALGDSRITVPGADIKLNEALQAKIASSKLIPDTTTTVTLIVGRPAFIAGASGLKLAQRAQGIYKELDRELVLVPMTGGATDAGFAVRSGKATVLESFGLAGFGYHAKDEYIEIDSIVPRLYLTTRLLMELGRE